jgi:hypothetical protein
MSWLLVRVELMNAQEAIDLLAVREVQTVPVDDRATADQVPDGCQIGDAERAKRPSCASPSLSRHFEPRLQVRLTSCGLPIAFARGV